MPAPLIGAFPTFAVPRNTIAFGTRIQSLVPGLGDTRGQGYRTKITTVKYTAAGTAHTLTFLRPLKPAGVNHSYLTAAVAGAATSAVLNRDPGAYAANAVLDNAATPSTADNLIAANDYFAMKKPDGTWTFGQVSAATTNSNGTVTVTIPAAPTGGFAAGTVFFFLGATTDTDPRTGAAHPAFSAAASATTTLDNNGGAVVQSLGRGEPILIDSNNATATGVLESATGVYAKY